MAIERSSVLVCGAGLAGLALAVAVPVVSHVRVWQGERAAAGVLTVVHEAQNRFRAGPGRGAFATDLAALTTPCPGEAPSPAVADVRRAVTEEVRYRFSLRAAGGAQPMGTDCHGGTTASDYYAAASPRTNGIDGRQAYAMSSAGRIFVFFDGIPPRESDMAPGGLAVPLDALPAFKIP